MRLLGVSVIWFSKDAEGRHFKEIGSMATTRAIVSSPFHITVESQATKHADGSTH